MIQKRKTLADAVTKEGSRYLTVRSFWRVLALSGDYPTVKEQFDAIALLAHEGLRLARGVGDAEWPVDRDTVIDALNSAKSWCESIHKHRANGVPQMTENVWGMVRDLVCNRRAVRPTSLRNLSDIELETIWDQFIDLGDPNSGEHAWLGDLHLDVQDVGRTLSKLGLASYWWSRVPDPKSEHDLVRYPVPTAIDMPDKAPQPRPPGTADPAPSCRGPDARALDELPFLTVARYWATELQVDEQDVLVMLARPVSEWLDIEKEYRKGVLAQRNPRLLPVHGPVEHGPEGEALRETLRQLAWGRSPLRDAGEALLRPVRLYCTDFEDWLLSNGKPPPRFWFGADNDTFFTGASPLDSLDPRGQDAAEPSGSEAELDKSEKTEPRKKTREEKKEVTYRRHSGWEQMMKEIAKDFDTWNNNNRSRAAGRLATALLADRKKLCGHIVTDKEEAIIQSVRRQIDGAGLSSEWDAEINDPFYDKYLVATDDKVSAPLDRLADLIRKGHKHAPKSLPGGKKRQIGMGK